MVLYDVEALETLRGEQTVPKQKKQSSKTTTPEKSPLRKFCSFNSCFLWGRDREIL